MKGNGRKWEEMKEGRNEKKLKEMGNESKGSKLNLFCCCYPDKAKWLLN